MLKRTESHKRIVYKKKASNLSFQNMNLPLLLEKAKYSHKPVNEYSYSQSAAKYHTKAKMRLERNQKHKLRTQNRSLYANAVKIHRPNRSMHDRNLNFLPEIQSKSSEIQSKFLASQSSFKTLIESDLANAPVLSNIKACYEEYIKLILKKPTMVSSSVQCSDLEIRLLSKQSDDTEDTTKREIPKINLKPAHSVDGFHDEFMQNYDDFSESWRRLIDQQQQNP